MNNTSPRYSPRPQRKLTSLELSAPARGALRRLKARQGMSFTHAVERGVLLLESQLLPEPMPIETAITLLGRTTPAPANRRKGGAK